MRGVSNSEDGARHGAAEGGGAGGRQVPHEELWKGVYTGGKALVGGACSFVASCNPTSPGSWSLVWASQEVLCIAALTSHSL